MNIFDFINKYAGKKIDYDNAFGAQCFLGHHCVLMSDWTYKPIKDVHVGDRVIGYNNKINIVTKTFCSEKDVIQIHTDLTDLYVTPEHPFYTKDGYFTKARYLLGKEPSLFDKQNYEESGMTDNELIFLGFWLGDGHISRHAERRSQEIRVTYGLKKRPFVQMLGVLSAESKHSECKDAFIGSIKKSEHIQLSRIILKMCAGETKKLPLIFTNREYELILRGFVAADGYRGKNFMTVTNTSLLLLLSMQAICILLGYHAKSIRLCRRRDKKIVINGKEVQHVKPLYKMYIKQKTIKRIFFKSKIVRSFRDTVYNIETDGTHTYICDNYKVHNCINVFRQHRSEGIAFPHTRAVGVAKDFAENYSDMPKEQKYFNLITDKIARETGDTEIRCTGDANKYSFVQSRLKINAQKKSVRLVIKGKKDYG